MSDPWLDTLLDGLAAMVAEAWPRPEPTPLDQIPPALGGTKPPGAYSFTRATDPSPLDALVISKQVAYINVSDELLMDTGAVPDTRVRKPVPWRTRLRYRIGDLREKLARRAYRAIAGYDVPEPGDW